MKKVLLILCLSLLFPALWSDRYTGVQPWQRPLSAVTLAGQSALCFSLFDWLQGRLNASYEHYLPGSGSIFLGLQLQNSLLTLPSMAQLWQSRDHFGLNIEVGMSYLLQNRSRGGGMRMDVALLPGYVHLQPDVPLFLAGVRARLGYQFSWGAFSVLPFWAAQLVFAFEGDEHAPFLTHLSSGQLFFLPEIPGLNGSIALAGDSNPLIFLFFFFGVRVGLPLSAS